MRQKFWEEVVELKNLDIVQLPGSEPGINGGGTALYVARRNREAANRASMAGHNGFRKTDNRILTESRSGIAFANGLLGEGAQI